jgi:cyclic-di-GMP-binding protein
MASFDIVNKVDHQTLDNAMNVAKKEILTRFDFKDSKSSIELDKKGMVINIVTENDMRLDSIIDVIRNRMVKQKIDPSALDESKEHYASGSMIKKEVKIKEGIDKETAKKIVKNIKDSKLKVQAQIMDDQVRVTGKKIDDLQEVIALMRRGDFGVPLQFINMKS